MNSLATLISSGTGLGLLAGTLTTIAYIPQLIKTWRSKSAQDLSWSMLLTLWLGIALWLAYGIFNQDLPVIYTNVVTLILSSIILALKLKYEYGHKKAVLVEAVKVSNFR